MTTYITSALAALQAAEFRPSHQLQALYYAVRWSSGIREFESLGSERWLEIAAGSVCLSVYHTLFFPSKLFHAR